MPDDRIDELISSHNEMKVEFALLTGELKGRCPTNERRIARLEDKRQNSSSSNGRKFWASLAVALAALATAIAAMAGRF